LPTCVLVPAASRNWIDLASVKLLMEESGSGRDVILARLIRIASGKLEDLLGFCPARQRYEESVRGNGRQSFYLSQRPVDPGSLTVTINGAAVTDCVLQDPDMGLLWRECGWPPSCDGSLNVVLTYHAGFLMPEQVSNWTAETEVATGGWVRSSAPSTLRFECTSAGTTGVTSPAWPDAAGETVTDGDAVWTAREAGELPAMCEDYAYATVLSLYATRKRAAGVSSWEVEGVSESYFATQTDDELPPGVIKGVLRFRAKYGGEGIA
jgi:hypothetical protein